ncbi:hypothetical protein BDA99DRAFT_508304 [Phascolomyces articulosus]|uniref:sterol 3beta-glucosyltransferase n=1 Tax=Phascolomyces articulosus TaxID=60185 RepID=A0AAD5KAF4_9FUNG|nr:hypothetical protein BDA99DRAFT_508304 [Phascolomyces articulosus]
METQSMQSDDKVITTPLVYQDADHCQGASQIHCQGTIQKNNKNKTSQDPDYLLRPFPLQREMSIECAESTIAYQKQKSITQFSEKIDDENDDGDEEDEHCSSDQEMNPAERVQQLFGLSIEERLIAEFPCYLLRLVTLPGWLYITNKSLCFYAALPRKKDNLQKTGYLFRKAHRTSPLSTRSYFQLKNNVLAWYNSAEDKYEPIGSIDLKHIMDVQDSSTRKYGFRIVGEKRNWTLAADSDVSQKEWMDELRRAIFVARNAGNSVRIVLPYSRIVKINRTFAFKFAEYIRVKLNHKNDLDNLDDEYYFSFFPDIDKAYQQIMELWNLQRKVPGVRFGDHHKDEENIEGTSSPSQDNVFNNTSGMSATMFIGALTNPASLFTNYYNNSNNKEKHRRTKSTEVPFLNNEGESSSTSRRSTFSSSTTTTTATTEDAIRKDEIPQTPMSVTLSVNSEDNKRKQRNSWSFGWLSSPPSSPVSDSPQQPETPQLSLPSPTDNTTQSPKEQRFDTNDVTKLNPAPKKKGRFRSSSTASIKQMARHTLGLSITPNISSITQQQQTPTSPSSPSENNNNQIETPSTNYTLLSSPTRTKSGRFRSSSFGGGLKKHIRTPSNSDLNDLLFSTHHHHNNNNNNIPSSPTKQSQQLQAAWIDSQYHDILLQTSMPPKNIQESDNDESQKKVAEHKLHKTFPMLGDSEKVVGAFSSALWRTLPYYGRLYYTLNYICFYSKVLAGRQKLVIPIADINAVRRLKSRGYYLLHSIGLVAKDMQEEIYLEFSSVDIRDACYALLYILINEKKTDEELAGRPRSIKMSEILATSTEHVMPPLEYSGPPILSSSPKIESFQQPSLPKMNMHITCLTIGSRGDVQPYIALCKQLQRDGHRCRIASHSEYQTWVEGHDLEFRSIGGDPGELMKLCIDNGFLSYSFVKDGSKFFYTWFDKLLETAWEACQGTDLLIESPSAMVGIHMAEKLEIPYFRSMPFPWTRTTRFPHPFAMQNYTSGRLLYNDMTYVMIDIALWTGTSKAINRFRRKTLELPPTTREKLELWNVPHIYSFSPSVLPPPKDWPDFIHCTGYWFLDNPDTSWTPSDHLLQFLNRQQDTRPIVYIGFGSIIVPDPKAMSQIIVEAVEQANVRAIVCKGWSSRSVNHQEDKRQVENENKNASDILENHSNILNLDSVPHDWLFPQIQGVVHHGGAGTTAAGLRAGLPTIIKPFFGDQRFWGQRIEELNVGVCISKLTTEKLSEALLEITQNSVIISKAKALGVTIRQVKF